MIAPFAPAPDLATYDHIVVAFSGGKDSLACLLSLFDAGVDRSKIELWHHDIDGREGSKLMDWTVTRDYCAKVAAALGVPIYFSWLEGGFEREMLRDKSLKAPTVWENPDGTLGRSGGVRGKLNTRLQFPQVSPDLSVRWCSAYLKIDVMSAALRGQARFKGARTLVVTGERAEESSARAKYLTFEPHRSNLAGSRHVDHWRPIHSLTVAQVWELIGRYRINPHPAYRAGFGRVSCQFCIFASNDQCASARALSPHRYKAVADYEAKFGKTIHRKHDMIERAQAGTPYAGVAEERDACNSDTFNEPVILAEGEWKLPRGAFAESCGPT
jgi:3'-phosphoadenosine 5'-phosphosulfate sulfotransferase (PAPS reductase)/FAD synthetase